MGSNMFDVVHDLEKTVNERINLAFSEIVKDLNMSLNNLLTSTLEIAEVLQETIRLDVSKLFGGVFNGSKLKAIDEFAKTDSEGLRARQCYKFKVEPHNDRINVKNEAKDTFSDNVKISSNASVLEEERSIAFEGQAFLSKSRTASVAKDRKVNESKIRSSNKNNQAYLSTHDLQCHECQSSFSTKGNLKEHMKHVHEKIKGWTCNQCDYESSKKSHLKRHLSTVHKMNY